MAPAQGRRGRGAAPGLAAPDQRLWVQGVLWLGCRVGDGMLLYRTADHMPSCEVDQWLAKSGLTRGARFTRAKSEGICSLQRHVVMHGALVSARARRVALLEDHAQVHHVLGPTPRGVLGPSLWEAPLDLLPGELRQKPQARAVHDIWKTRGWRRERDEVDRLAGGGRPRVAALLLQGTPGGHSDGAWRASSGKKCVCVCICIHVYIYIYIYIYIYTCIYTCR